MSIATALNFSNTTPAAPSGKQLIVPQNDGGAPTCNESFYDPVMVGDTGSGGLAGNVPAPSAGDAAAGKFLKADGTWEVPAGSGIGTFTEEVVAFSGTSGSLAHAPSILIGLFRNGVRMSTLATGIMGFSISTAAVTLDVAAGGSDVFIAVYFH